MELDHRDQGELAPPVIHLDAKLNRKQHQGARITGGGHSRENRECPTVFVGRGSRLRGTSHGGAEL